MEGTFPGFLSQSHIALQCYSHILGEATVAEKELSDLGRSQHLGLASPVAQMVKHVLVVRETRVWSLGGKDALEKAMATHAGTLAWKSPWREEPGRLQSMASQSQTRLSDFTFTSALSDGARSWPMILFLLPTDSFYTSPLFALLIPLLKLPGWKVLLTLLLSPKPL